MSENFPKVVLLHLVNEINKKKLDFEFQPIVIDQKKIQLPYNHDGGTVRCVFNGDDYRRQKINCKVCKKDFEYKSIYYDLSLHQIVIEVWQNPQLCHTKSIKIHKNGAWEASTMEKQDDQFTIIDQTFSQLEDYMVIRCTRLNDNVTVFQNPGLIPQVKSIIDKELNLNGVEFPNLKSLTVSKWEEKGYIRGFELKYNGVSEQLQLGVRDSNHPREQVRESYFHVDSQIFVHTTGNPATLYIVGADSTESKSSGYFKTYRVQLPQLLYDSCLWSDQKFAAIEQFTELYFKRTNYLLVNYKDALFAIGGVLTTYTNNTTETAIPQVEILDVTYHLPSPKWEFLCMMPEHNGVFAFESEVNGELVTITKGKYVQQQSGYSLTRNFEGTYVFNMETRNWNS